MVLKLYIFREKRSCKIHYATGHNSAKARVETGLPSKDLDLLKIETIPVKLRFINHGFQPFKPLADRRKSQSSRTIE